MPDLRLKFGVTGNAKLPPHIATFSLPTGFTCPGALACLAKADRKTGRIEDGPQQVFRCFAASMESARPSVRQMRWHNFDVLKKLGSVRSMTEVLVASFEEQRQFYTTMLRIHVAGDFFSQAYFDAWLEFARRTPDIQCYAYTKSLSFWAARKDVIPDNLTLVASRGGRQDHLIDEHGFREVIVVPSPEVAAVLGLDVDHDDSHAYDKSVQEFALVIHGTQPAGSAASEALNQERRMGRRSGYGRRPVNIPAR